MRASKNRHNAVVGSVNISGFLPGAPGRQSLKLASVSEASIEGNLWL